MRLITTDDLTASFKKHLKSATHIDMAVAWATSSGPLEPLCSAADDKVKVRAIVGLYGGFTSPDALRALHENARLKIVSDETGIFHPKFYLFHLPRRTLCWVGSANFSRGGFSQNTELVHEFEDPGYAREWFDQLWKTLPRATKQEIEQYALTRPIRKAFPPPSEPDDELLSSSEHPISLISSGKVKDWSGYLDAVRHCDAYWRDQQYHFSVLGMEHSYLSTITSGRAVVRKASWDNLNRHEIIALLGHAHDDDGGSHGLLGSMRGAGAVQNVFLEQNPEHIHLRRDIHAALKEVVNAKDRDFPDIAVDTLEFIKSHERFGVACASRFLALARPDKAVSVNDGSRIGLSKISGLPKSVNSLGSASNYKKLLEWVYSQPWYQTPKPNDEAQREIWSRRDALMDSFVYGYDWA